MGSSMDKRMGIGSRLLVAVAAAVLAVLPEASFAARTRTVTVASGDTLTLGKVGTGHNTSTNSIVAQGGAILRLTDTTLSAYLVVTNGEVTLVAPESAESVHFDGGLFDEGGGSLKVEGATRLTFGTDTTDSAFFCILAATNVTFAATEGVAGIVLTNKVCVNDCPTDAACPVRAAEGALLAFTAQKGLRKICRNLGKSEDLANFTLEKGENLQMMSNAVFPSNTTVTVKGGANFILKACGVVAAEQDWSGYRATDTWNSTSHPQLPPFSSVTNIVLASDENGRAVVTDQCAREFDFMGAISGDGDFVKAGWAYERERTNLRGLLTFKGSVRMVGNDLGVIVEGASFGDPSNPITLATYGERLQIRGNSPVPTNRVYIASLDAMNGSRKDGDASQELYAYNDTYDMTWEIDRFHATCVLNANNGRRYTYQVNKLLSGSRPVITGVVTLKLLAAESDTQITAAHYNNGTSPVLDLSAFEGEVPPIVVNSGTSLTIIGAAGKTLAISGEGQAFDENGNAIVFGDVTAVKVPTNTTQKVVMPAFAPSLTNWAAKVAQWYDASAADTLGGYPKNSDGTTPTYRGNLIINRWGDKRYGTNVVHMYNGRSINGAGTGFGDRCDQVNPYVVKGGLNGLDYLSFGTYQKATDKENLNLPGAAEARRLLMVTAGYTGNTVSPNASLSCACAIMVFGSANGGGKALLGMKGYGYRSGTTTNDTFAANAFETMYVDGECVNGTIAKPNGSWQIITLPLNGQAVNAIGWSSAYDNAGGQDYAEIILFGTMPTDVERRACEVYLAKKWGLTGSYRGQRDVLPALEVTGGGSLTIEGQAEVRGGFHGDVTVAKDATIALTALPLPPDETIVPSTNEGRIVWFDPDVANGVYHGSTTLRALNVNAVRERNEKGALFGHRACSGLNSGCDRRPWADRSSHGDGLVRTWLDFGNYYAAEEKEKFGGYGGNTLRTQTTWSDSTTCNPITGVREGLIVLDTVNGGGTPVGSDISMSTTKRGGTYGRIVGSPIWPQKTGVFANVTTWLDGTWVDGTSRGFNGCPEVLGFAFEADWQVGAFGSYAQTDGSSLKNGGLVMGEVLLFGKKLNADLRKKVTAYLAHKWFGKVLDGYADLTRMTVKGEGRVTAASATNLPQFDASFSGVFAPQNADLSFTVDPATSQTAATDVWAKPGTLELGGDDTVRVNIASATNGEGWFKLVERCALAEGEVPRLVVSGSAEVLQPITRKSGATKCRLVVKDGSLFLYVPPRGLVIIAR